MIRPGTYFISGIDTDAGKSYCTGWLARELAKDGHSVITQKFVQTGNQDFSEDIDVHRRLMGVPRQGRDLDHTTAPVIFTYPCSAQLAARIDGRDIDLNIIDHSREILSHEYDYLLIEGAGGLMVPLTDEVMQIDYPMTRRLPVILVTNGRLGSINHTILSLEALQHRAIRLAAVLYNRHYDYDAVIAADTHDFIWRYLQRHFPRTPLIDVPSLKD